MADGISFHDGTDITGDFGGGNGSSDDKDILREIEIRNRGMLDTRWSPCRGPLPENDTVEHDISSQDTHAPIQPDQAYQEHKARQSRP